MVDLAAQMLREFALNNVRQNAESIKRKVGYKTDCPMLHDGRDVFDDIYLLKS